MIALRNLRTDDEAGLHRILNFIKEHPTRGIRARPEDQIELARKDGLVQFLEEDGDVCGCSFVYRFVASSSQSPATIYSEIGTMLVVKNGLRLQQILAETHILQLTLDEYHYAANHIFAVVEPKTASEHILATHVTMQPWTAPDQLKDLRREAGTPFAENKYCLISTLEISKRAIRSLKSRSLGNKEFRAPKGDATISIELNWFDDKLLDEPS